MIDADSAVRLRTRTLSELHHLIETDLSEDGITMNSATRVSTILALHDRALRDAVHLIRFTHGIAALRLKRKQARGYGALDRYAQRWGIDVTTLRIYAAAAREFGCNIYAFDAFLSKGGTYKTQSDIIKQTQVFRDGGDELLSEADRDKAIMDRAHRNGQEIVTLAEGTRHEAAANAYADNLETATAQYAFDTSDPLGSAHSTLLIQIAQIAREAQEMVRDSGEAIAHLSPAMRMHVGTLRELLRSPAVLAWLDALLDEGIIE